MNNNIEQEFYNLELPEERGPFHIIGDVHGCFEELVELLENLGYQIAFDKDEVKYLVSSPDSGKAVFVGDLVDRGPNSPEVLRLVMDMVEQKVAYCVTGNHDDKLLRMLLGRNVQIRHGLELTKAQLESYDAVFRERVKYFLANLPHHLVLDEGRLVVAHAGLEERLHGRNTKGVRNLCLYGPTTGESDEKGLPVRLDWAADYCGKAIVVYGHTPVHEPIWRNNTINIDTGCVFGGSLTALTYPDHVITTVVSRHTYAESVRPFIRYQQLHPQASPS
ncbi:metallophosphoesterase [Pontibacter korlensis]|uniref:metallophosphoesterase n=1 Tax=Pontibacter korlensis TaxID=400092 RepID=UPI00061AA23E|nr:metallophosphoesterase [Pontibacter korlensis]